MSKSQQNKQNKISALSIIDILFNRYFTECDTSVEPNAVIDEMRKIRISLNKKRSLLQQQISKDKESS